MKNLKRVKVDFTGFRKYKALSDLIPTFCCELQASYFVIFPAIVEKHIDIQTGAFYSIPYGTYFYINHVKEVKQ